MVHDIPLDAMPLVERGKADGEPAVRAQAEQIGKPSVAVGQRGMGGQAGGFF